MIFVSDIEQINVEKKTLRLKSFCSEWTAEKHWRRRTLMIKNMTNVNWLTDRHDVFSAAVIVHWRKKTNEKIGSDLQWRSSLVWTNMKSVNTRVAIQSSMKIRKKIKNNDLTRRIWRWLTMNTTKQNTSKKDFLIKIERIICQLKLS